MKEDAAKGTVIGTFAATDANSADILTYVLTGDGAGSFAIDIRTGEVTVDGALTFETPDGPTYALTITAYDPSNAMDDHTLTVTATDVNEKPSVPASTSPTPATASVAENSAIAILGTFRGSDVDAADTGEGNLPKLTLAGDDMGAFKLTDDNTDGTPPDDRTYELRFKAMPNFEAQ